jgi:PilZ domain
VADDLRRYDRIDIELPCRLYIPGQGSMKFQAYTTTRNLGLGGLFVASSFLLKAGLELFAELSLPEGPLAVRSRVTYAAPLGGERQSGMGLEFLGVDAHGRETLLRFFTPPRYREFYGAMTRELPHIGKELPLRDVSLVLNLWEEWKMRGDGERPAAPARRARARR